MPTPTDSDCAAFERVAASCGYSLSRWPEGSIGKGRRMSASDDSDREAFAKWHETPDGGWSSIFEIWRAGAAHARNEADSLRAELERVKADLRDARNEAESAREQARGENALRVEAQAEMERVKAERAKYLEDARVQRERVDDWEMEAKWRESPPPDAALRERVVEAAMAWRARFRLQPAYDSRECIELVRACAALDAATPKPDPVREAAGRLRALDVPGNIETRLDLDCGGTWIKARETLSVGLADLRTVLDALDAKGGA